MIKRIKLTIIFKEGDINSRYGPIFVHFRSLNNYFLLILGNAKSILKINQAKQHSPVGLANDDDSRFCTVATLHLAGMCICGAPPETLADSRSRLNCFSICALSTLLIIFQH